MFFAQSYVIFLTVNNDEEQSITKDLSESEAFTLHSFGDNFVDKQWIDKSLPSTPNTAQNLNKSNLTFEPLSDSQEYLGLFKVVN